MSGSFCGWNESTSLISRMEVVEHSRELAKRVEISDRRIERRESPSKLADLESSRISCGLGMSELEAALESFVNNDKTQLALQLNSFLEGMMYFKPVKDPTLMGDFLILNDCQILCKLNSENFQMLAIV